MIAILNALFEAQAAEIRGHGGEILKFIGDGLLAIFPIAGANAAAAVAKTAVPKGIASDPQLHGWGFALSGQGTGLQREQCGGRLSDHPRDDR